MTGGLKSFIEAGAIISGLSGEPISQPKYDLFKINTDTTAYQYMFVEIELEQIYVQWIQKFLDYQIIDDLELDVPQLPKLMKKNLIIYKLKFEIMFIKFLKKLRRNF